MGSETLIEAISSEALGYPAKAKEIRIIDQDTLNAANGFLRGVKALLGKISETFEPIIKQAHEAHRRALEEKKKHEDPLLQAERIVKAEIGRYLTEQDHIRREADKAFEEALAVEPPKPEPIPEPVKAQGTFIRKDLKWRVIDRTAIPQDFLVIDSIKINAVFRIQREKMSIPGIEVYEETTVVARA